MPPEGKCIYLYMSELVPTHKYDYDNHGTKWHEKYQGTHHVHIYIFFRLVIGHTHVKTSFQRGMSSIVSKWVKTYKVFRKCFFHNNV